MTVPFDLLGRPPIRKPVARRPREDWVPLRRRFDERGRLLVTVPPVANTADFRRNEVTLPTPPWEACNG